MEKVKEKILSIHENIEFEKKRINELMNCKEYEIQMIEPEIDELFMLTKKGKYNSTIFKCFPKSTLPDTMECYDCHFIVGRGDKQKQECLIINCKKENRKDGNGIIVKDYMKLTK